MATAADVAAPLATLIGSMVDRADDLPAGQRRPCSRRSGRGCRQRPLLVALATLELLSALRPSGRCWHWPTTRTGLTRHSPMFWASSAAASRVSRWSPAMSERLWSRAARLSLSSNPERSQMSATPGPPSGWYPDPAAPQARERLDDGTDWTDGYRSTRSLRTRARSSYVASAAGIRTIGTTED
jgi:Protein of unknown function (DUF2510)